MSRGTTAEGIFLPPRYLSSSNLEYLFRGKLAPSYPITPAFWLKLREFSAPAWHTEILKYFWEFL